MSAALRVLVVCIVLAAGCGTPEAGPEVTTETTSPEDTSLTTPDGTPEPDPDGTVETTVRPPIERSTYFETVPVGEPLPDESTCAELVLADESFEARPDNAEANATIPSGLEVTIDGPEPDWNEANAPRVTGNFTGTTEQILRWGACKWGFDEDTTMARAVTESSWNAGTEGDETDDPEACALLGFEAPCAQSYGLLQVKGTVHLGTHPASAEASAFGVDYAMAWLRACYEGSFTWLEEQGYEPGDELGCVGAWFSGNWWDQPANDYVGEVRFHLGERTWESYGA